MLTAVFVVALLAGGGGLWLQFETIRDSSGRLTVRDWIAEAVVALCCACVVATAVHSLALHWWSP